MELDDDGKYALNGNGIEHNKPFRERPSHMIVSWVLHHYQANPEQTVHDMLEWMSLRGDPNE